LDSNCIWLKLTRKEQNEMLLKFVSLGEQDKNNYAVKSVVACYVLDSAVAFLCFFFLFSFAVLALKLRSYTISHSFSPYFFVIEKFFSR
jgi:hypothetical protein